MYVLPPPVGIYDIRAASASERYPIHKDQTYSNNDVPLHALLEHLHLIASRPERLHGGRDRITIDGNGGV